MAYDKLVDSNKLNTALEATADAIREKTGDTESITWDETEGFASAVEAIETKSDPVLSSVSIAPSTSQQVITPNDGVDGFDEVIVEAMPTATQATPSISVSTTTGKITAKATQSEGYVVEGSKSATKQLTVQPAKTVTPSTSDVEAVAKNVYTTGAVTVKGDTNLVASNIKSGVSIFGVSGSYTGGSMQTAQGTITPTSNLVSGSGTVAMTLTGLTFTPQFVAVFLVYKTSLNSSAEYVFGGAMEGLRSGMVQYTVGNTRLDAEGESCKLTITSDGFTIATDTSDTCQFGTLYEYIAIG